MIFQYWHSASPPGDVVAALASFDRCSPELPREIFDAAKAETFIARHYSAREVAAFRACAVPAMQADYFRYCAVHALGGIYVDADFECVGDMSSLLEAQPGGVLFGRRPGRITAVFGWPFPVGAFGAVSNDLFAFPKPGHPLLGMAVRVATANVEGRVADGPEGIWVTTGPGIFTSMYLLRGLGSADAFLDYSKGTVLEASAPLFCEVVGDATDVAELLEGVAIRPRREHGAWVRPVKLRRPDSGPDVYWPELTGSIFRRSST